MNTIQTTVGKLAERLNVKYVTAAAIVDVMKAQGKGKEIGKQPQPTGKGKPSTIYELDNQFVLNLETVAVN
jgi:hypothetical protein